MIIQMLQVVVNSFDFTEESQFFSTKLTPTKMLKKYQNPLGNYEPFIEIMGIMMKSITEVKSKVMSNFALNKYIFKVVLSLECCAKCVLS